MTKNGLQGCPTIDDKTLPCPKTPGKVGALNLVEFKDSLNGVWKASAPLVFAGAETIPSDVLAISLSQLLPETVSSSPPDTIQVCPLGRFVYQDARYNNGKPIVIDIEPDDVAAMIASKDQTEVVIDYEHQTLSGAEAPAAGWAIELINGGARGLLAKVRWLPEAAAKIISGAYKYISPVILKNTADKTTPGKRIRTYLHSIALTNRPYIPNIEPLVATAGVPGLVYPVSANNKQKETHMEQKEFFAMIGALLGLAPTATAEDVTAACKQSLAVATAATSEIAAIRKALDLKDSANASEITGTIVALKQSHGQVGDLATQVAALKQDLAKRDAATAVGEAVKAGKITPAQIDWAKDYATKDPAGFSVFVAKAAVVIDTAKRAPEGEPPTQSAEEADAVMAVAKMMGTEAEIKKTTQKPK